MNILLLPEMKNVLFHIYLKDDANVIDMALEMECENECYNTFRKEYSLSELFSKPSNKQQRIS